MRPQRARRGVAAVELAILLPFLAFMFVITVDWARIFYFSVTVTNCARNGAVYACDPFLAQYSPYSDFKQAALADSNLTPTPDVRSTNGSDSNGSYVEVTVSYPFKTVTNFPGVPSTNNVTRTVRMYSAPRLPN
jgi:Flp pilus assembly protein TadG